MDQRINNRGLPMDRELIVKANEVYLTYAEHLRRRMRKITGISNPNSVQQLMAWLESNGHRLPNLQKATVAALLERPDVESGIKDVLLMRQETGMASVKKFKAMADRLADDDRIRGSFKYYGARTGRWAGGGVQPQNMTSSSLGGETVEEMQDILATAVRAVKANDWQLLDMLYDRPVDVLASVVRCAIQAPEGKQLVVADLSSIENVVLGWLADCGPILTLYRTGKDAYKDFATRVFNIEYDEVQKSQRKFAKPPVLGCGYGLGGDGLVAYAAAMGVDLSAMYEPQIDRVMACASALGLNMYQVKSAPPGTVNLDLGGKSLTPEHKATAVGHRLVGIYRDSYPEIPAFWNQLKEAVFAAVREKRDVRCGKLVYRYRDPFLFCELPSGRCIAYPKPRVEMISHAKFGKILAFTYEGLNSVTKRWERMDSAKGKLAEQVTQALARDVLVHGIQNAEREGFEVVGHVHDEAITLSDASREGEGQRLINCLTTLPDWARGMPVGATAWTGKRYMKD
jgi:DNA polymerase